MNTTGIHWLTLLAILLVTVMGGGAEAGQVPPEVAAYLAKINEAYPPPVFSAGARQGEVPQRKRVVLIDAPGDLNQVDTEYRLTRDVTADATAFRIRASRVTLNLNGHRVVYNEKEPGNGVFVEKWWAEDVAIMNGSLVQGAASSSGGFHANEASPIRTVNCRRLTIAGLTVRYAGADVIGAYVDGCSGAHIHHNTFVNVAVFDNTLILAAEENYRQSGFSSWGRCVWVGVLNPKQQVTFHDNRIIAYSTDGKAKAAAVVICANAKNTVRNTLLFRNNEIASTWSNLLLADSYGSAGGYSQFVGNRFVRLGAATGYRTFRSQYSSIPSTAQHGGAA